MLTQVGYRIVSLLADTAPCPAPSLPMLTQVYHPQVGGPPAAGSSSRCVRDQRQQLCHCAAGEGFLSSECFLLTDSITATVTFSWLDYLRFFMLNSNSFTFAASTTAPTHRHIHAWAHPPPPLTTHAPQHGHSTASHCSRPAAWAHPPPPLTAHAPQLAKGGDLEDLLKSAGKLGEREARSIVIQMLSGLRCVSGGKVGGVGGTVCIGCARELPVVPLAAFVSTIARPDI